MELQMKTTLTTSENMSHEYCCTIVKIGEIKPIEGADKIVQTEVEGRTIVIGKDEVKEGDIMFYVSNECELNKDFLYVNNLYDDPSLNKDPEKKGYINKRGRVRMIKLRGVYSMGFLFPVEAMKNFFPAFNIETEQLQERVGVDFDTVDGTLFVKAYVPPMPEPNVRLTKEQRRAKRLSFDRMIPGQFALHYDTKQLNREISKLRSNDIVSISVKCHGTSGIFANVLCLQPRWGGIYSKIFNYLPKFLQFTKKDYGVIYSSRTVIKNKTINPKVNGGFYNTDVWGEYYELLKDVIPAGITIYGEILGYLSGSTRMIQKNYDYGCNPGENKLMIYRVTKTEEDGSKKEYNINEVITFTLKIQDSLQEIGKDPKKIFMIPLLYHGKLTDLYPEIDPTNCWHENVLEAMKNDVEHFGMEKKEPLCRNKVPREGICLRIDDDPVVECFKLKAESFLMSESKMIDEGIYEDIETQQRYE